MKCGVISKYGQSKNFIFSYFYLFLLICMVWNFHETRKFKNKPENVGVNFSDTKYISLYCVQIYGDISTLRLLSTLCNIPKGLATWLRSNKALLLSNAILTRNYQNPSRLLNLAISKLLHPSEMVIITLSLKILLSLLCYHFSTWNFFGVVNPQNFSFGERWKFCVNHNCYWY